MDYELDDIIKNMKNEFENKNSIQEKIESLKIKFSQLIEFLQKSTSIVDSKLTEYNKLHCELEDLYTKLDKFSKHCPDTKEEWDEYDSLNEPLMKKWEEIYVIQNELNNIENSQKNYLEEIEKTKREIFINQHIN